MKWSPQQEQALKQVSDWLDDPDSQLFRLFGYAGTGKTTLAKHLAEGVKGKVLFAAYTGKAAHVLSTKGCPAQTIHQLIYRPKGNSKKTLLELQVKLSDRLIMLSETEALRDPEVRRLKVAIAQEEENMKRMFFDLNDESPVREAALVVIDECSMVDQQMGEDLMSFGTKILVLGDPAQLPPVGGGGYFTNAAPDLMLQEIHRQAADSPIIHMATLVRTGQGLPVGRYGDCTVHAIGTPMEAIVREADQLICGRNKTRHAANRRVRQFLGLQSEIPLIGDRMVCLKNNRKAGILNGQIWLAAADADMLDDDMYLLTAYNEDDPGSVLKFKVWNREPKWFEKEDAEMFDFGYCLTCHKSQGSQWDHVMVMDESASFRADAKRWLYTAITRAAEKLDVVKM